MAGYGKVTAPRRWKSSPDHPQAQLAYVTQDEIDMLVDANIYGSMDGKPNRGPKGIISLQGDIGGYEPPSQPSGGNVGGGGGQGPHWDPPSQVVTVPPPWVADPTPPIIEDPNWANEFADLPPEIVETFPEFDPGAGTSSDDLPDDYVYEGDYVPYSTDWQENLADAMGGLSYDWVDPESDFFTDDEGNIIGSPGEGLWDPLAGLNYDEMATMYDMGEFYTGPTLDYSGWDNYGGPSVPEQEQQWYGERRPSLAEWARQHWFSESLGDVEAKEAQRQAEGLGAATMSNMDRMYAKDFSAEAMGPDPFFDPEFSGGYYEDWDPIYAGMDLFERARG